MEGVTRVDGLALIDKEKCLLLHLTVTLCHTNRSVDTYSANSAVTHVVMRLRVDVRHEPFNTEDVVILLFELNDVVPDGLILLLMDCHFTMCPLVDAHHPASRANTIEPACV